MIERRRNIGARVIVIRCDDDLQRQADFVLQLLEGAEELRGAGFLADGKRVQVGWSILTMKSSGRDLLVCEPDYSGNPFESIREDCSSTLRIQGRQNDVLRGFGLDGVPVSFEQKIVISKGCLGERKLYMERRAPGKDDTGWYVGRRDGDNSALDAVRVYQLLALRPALLPPLLLPPGYMVLLDGDRIETFVNDKDEPVTPGPLN